MDLLEGMLQRDKDNFVRVCNKLLGTCFLCKGNITARSDYYFVLKHKAEMAEYLEKRKDVKHTFRTDKK